MASGCRLHCVKKRATINRQFVEDGAGTFGVTSTHYYFGFSDLPSLLSSSA